MFWLLAFGVFYAQIPTYYSGVDFTQDALSVEIQLRNLITATHNPIPYTSDIEIDTWDVLMVSDLDLDSSDNILLIYGYDDVDNESNNDRLRDKNLSCHGSGCSGLWNREHIFAKSYAEPNMQTDEPGIGTDVHNLRACDSQKNSSRSNRTFTYGSSNVSFNTGNYEFYPGEEWKGDVARAIMYMTLRYENEVDANQASLSSNSYHPDMPDIFLTWNIEDPVSEFEIQRNNVIEMYQGNRNPFIDNPYLATMIWGGNEAENTWNLSIEDLDFVDNEVQIYPNPVSFQLSVNQSVQSLQVFSMEGIKWIESQDNIINVQHLPAGVYRILIALENGETQVESFIKK